MQENPTLQLSISLCSRPSCSRGKSWIQDDVGLCIKFGIFESWLSMCLMRSLPDLDYWTTNQRIHRARDQSWTFFNNRNSSRDAIFHHRSCKILAQITIADAMIALASGVYTGHTSRYNMRFIVMHCDTICNALWYKAMHCNTICDSLRCIAIQYAMHCDTKRCIAIQYAIHCDALQYNMQCIVIQSDASRYNMRWVSSIQYAMHCDT